MCVWPFILATETLLPGCLCTCIIRRLYHHKPKNFHKVLLEMHRVHTHTHTHTNTTDCGWGLPMNPETLPIISLQFPVDHFIYWMFLNIQCCSYHTHHGHTPSPSQQDWIRVTCHKSVHVRMPQNPRTPPSCLWTPHTPPPCMATHWKDTPTYIAI